jgi:hypothetical protein
MTWRLMHCRPWSQAMQGLNMAGPKKFKVAAQNCWVESTLEVGPASYTLNHEH